MKLAYHLFWRILTGFFACALVFVIVTTPHTAYADGDVPASDTAGTVDVVPYVTKLELTTRDNGNKDMLDPEHPVGDFDGARLTIHYKLNSDVLDDQTPDLGLQLPQNITERINLYDLPHGDVLNASGQVVGKYNVDKNGFVRIEFTNESYIENDITGSFFVDFYATRDNIPDKITIGNHTITPQIAKQTDLSVEKKAAQTVIHNNRTVDFTVMVRSPQYGSGGPIKIADSMTNLEWDGDIAIRCVKADNSSCAEPRTESAMPAELPELKAGESYEITYRAKLPDSATGSVEQAANEFTATYTDRNGEPSDVRSTVQVTFDCTGVEVKKTAQTTGEQNDQVHWTIRVTVAADGALDGWRINDVFNNHALASTDLVPGTAFTITAPDGSAATVDELDGYVFQESKQGEYVIDYTTPVSTVAGTGTNRVTLTDPDHPQGSKEDSTTQPNPVGTPNLNKEALGYDFTSDNKVQLHWRATIDTAQAGLPAGWKLTDERKQWGSYAPVYTADMMRAMIASLQEGMRQAGYESEVTYDFRLEDWNTHVASPDDFGNQAAIEFSVTFAEPLPMGKRLQLAFDSVSDKAVTENATFLNQYKVGWPNIEYWSNTAEQHVTSALPETPTIVKRDANNTSGGESTTYTYTQGKELSWQIDLSVPQSYPENGEPLVVTEHLPQELVPLLKKLEMWTDQDNARANLLAQDGAIVQGETEQYPGIEASGDAGELRFRVAPKYAGTVLHWIVSCDVPQDAAVVKGEGNSSYTNTVSFTSAQGSGSSTQTQTLQPQKHEDRPTIAKTFNGQSHGTLENNLLPYTVTINPDARTLAPGVNELVLRDVLEYSPYNKQGTRVCELTPVPGSLRLWQLDSAGNTVRQLGTSEYGYEFDTAQGKDGQGAPIERNIIIVRVPDAMALRMEYTYRAMILKGTGIASLSGLGNGYGAVNSATLVNGETSVSKVFANFSSGAEANIDGITAYKVNAENYNEMIPGAVYDLYRWENDAWGNPIGSYTSGQDGKFVIQERDGQGNPASLRTGMPYRLVERTAPEGFELNDTPYDFYIYTKDSMKAPEASEDYQPHALMLGQTIPVEDRSLFTRIRVEKRWLTNTGSSAAPKYVDVTSQHTNTSASIEYKVTRTKTLVPASAQPLKLNVTVVNPDTKVNASRYSGTLYSGSVAKLTFIWNKWWRDHSADYQIVVNGVVLDKKAGLQWIDLGNEVIQTVWEGTLHGDTTVEMYAQNVPEDCARVTVQIESVEGEAQPDPDFMLQGTLTAKNGWHDLLYKLPLREPQYDPEHNVTGMLVYRYSITETDEAHLVNYLNNANVTSGTVLINNEHVDSAGFALPSAGGQGRMTWLQIVIGAGLIMMVPFIMRKELFPEIAESTGLGGPRHKAQKL